LRLGHHLVGMLVQARARRLRRRRRRRRTGEAAAAAAAAELMTHHALGYERRALIAELLRLFRVI
jgi:hypothetical protein